MSIKMHFPATLDYTPSDCNTTLQNKRQHQLIFPLFDYNGYAVYVCLTVMLPATAIKRRMGSPVGQELGPHTQQYWKNEDFSRLLP